MKKIVLAVLTAATLFTMVGCKKADSKKFVLGLDASFPPMGFTEADGSITGDLITGLTTRLNTLADSDDTTLDQMSEIVEYIKSNKLYI